MHLVVLRREVHERHPALGQALYDALCEAKALSIKKMRDVSVTRYMLPWLASDIEEIDALFGADHWAYGVEANRRTLEQFVDYLADQHLIPSRVPVEGLFLPVRESRNPDGH
jgi:4,5-dihydroxyphthalate decarboxylase